MRNRWRMIVPMLTAIAVLLSGCGTSDGQGGDKRSLVFVSFGGAYQKAQTTAFVEPFQKSSGITVNQDSPTSYSKLKAMVDAGNVTWDVVDGASYFAIANCEKYLEKLDYSVIDVSKINPKFVSPCAVPDQQYTYVLMYNKEKYASNPPTSYTDFFDLKRFPGKRAIWNSPIGGALEAALLGDGVAPAKLYPLDVPRALQKLDTIRGQLLIAGTPTLFQQMMESREADMVIMSVGRAYDGVKNGAPFAPVWDKTVVGFQVLMVPKGAPNKDAAMKFIAHAVGAEAQGHLTENIAYAPINSDAQPSVSALQKSFLVFANDAKIAAQSVVQDSTWWAANLDKVTTEWTAWTQRS